MQLKINDAFKKLSEKVDSFPWQNEKSYAWFLAQTYYFVHHSTKLLMVAAGRMKKEDQEICKRFVAHLGEENGHDIIALKDLENLGYNIEDFPELPETRMFWEAQYYKIEHNDPLSLLGYIYVLEVIGSKECPRLMPLLSKSYKANCCNFIRIHGEDDPEHVDKALGLINSLPSERLRWIQENFDQTVNAYLIFLDCIVTNSCSQKILQSA